MQYNLVYAFSPQKSGTHLLQELMLALGYKIGGEACRIDPRNRAHQARHTAWIEHDPDIRSKSTDFLRRWHNNRDDVRVIYNYRDPRDMLVSFVNYLSGEREIGNFTIYLPYREILRTMPLEDQLSFAIEDRCFPGHNELRAGLWLLRHPRVVKVSYEDLVGTKGGGNHNAQLDAIQRVAHHVGAECDAKAIAEKIYNPNSFTFRTGRIGAWRGSFSYHNRELFKREFPGLVEAYGYDW